MEKSTVIDKVKDIKNIIDDLSIKVWENPEIAGEERYASSLFKDILKNNGFIIKEVNNMEYAFIAEFGSGHPVIAVLGEYDALAGMSQKLEAVHNPLVPSGNGHGCGHNLLGSAALGSVLAIKKYMEEADKKGTIRFYGCPEEETLIGKVKMIKEGAFEGCDLALSWHPMNANAAVYKAYLSNNSIKFNFTGKSAHAGASPHLGRSALDAVELMNVGANYLREHVIDKARIHYTITKAGGPPNIVPKEAESWYFVRAPHRKDVEEITQRLYKVADGAAMMTETSVEKKLISGCYELLPNDTLFELTHKNMEEISGPEYSEKDLQFALDLQKSINASQILADMELYGQHGKELEAPLHQGLVDKNIGKNVNITGSSDSGDVSWIMPMNCFLTACFPWGVTPHSWQATASAGSGIGLAGMLYATKIFTGIMYDLLNYEELVKKAIAEFKERTKTNKYRSPLS
ncbi:MAG: amidohydrolase [Tissierellia bacterium]|nr:amidohydrolase [Tissierellia bacterium]